jgi:hypothetical protein
MNRQKVFNVFIALVWLTNGLFCKVLNLVPRHQQIVERILGSQFGYEFTKVIGFAEICIAIWIFSGFKSRINAIVQILIIATMNTIEFMLAPDLLLWGKYNALFAFLFILLIYFNEFGNRSAKA